MSIEAYEKFEPTDKRPYTLIVSRGLAYRETFPDEDDFDTEKALDLLNHTKEMIEDKQNWMPLTYEHEGGLSTYFEPIKAVDKHGDRCPPSFSIAKRWTLLGAIECAATKHYTPDSLRIALNAMQMAIEGWISLGFNHDDRRQQEQKLAIAGLDDYIDDAMARDGHNRCLSILNDAIVKLQATVSQPTVESSE